jgi:hypothetical protein
MHGERGVAREMLWALLLSYGSAELPWVSFVDHMRLGLACVETDVGNTALPSSPRYGVGLH